jgi:hypothetical protein
MSTDDALASRLAFLRGIIRRGFDDAPEQIQGFLIRTLATEPSPSRDLPLFPEPSLEACFDAARFGGYPSLARAGFRLAHQIAQGIDAVSGRIFLQCIDRQRGRPAYSQAELAGDAIALLGIADGLHTIDLGECAAVQEARSWLHSIIDQHGGFDARLNRARLLAGDILDGQGRFGRTLAYSNDLRIAALDLCLWNSWSDILEGVEHPDAANRQQLFKRLISEPPPAEGEVLHAAAWLTALDVLTAEFAASMVPDTHQVSRILAATQGSFRRWRWEDQPTRRGVMPTRWLIDKEADIQAFLLAVLYPYFRSQLQDEQYLRGFGLRQGRFDFAITSLRLIVEVKILRTSADINDLEAQIADDLSLYFKDSNPFDSMIVYVYDDRDVREPERYTAICDALKRRSDRIINVIIIERPSMIPGRANRAS